MQTKSFLAQCLAALCLAAGGAALAQQTDVLGRVEASVAQSSALVAPFFAVAPPGGRTDETFRQAIAQAVRQHPSIQSADLGALEAGAAVDEARGRQYPQIDLGIDGRQSLTNSGRTQQTNPALVLSLSQLVYDFGATADRIEAARSLETGARFRSTAAAQDFALRAASTWYDVVRLRRLAQIAAQDVERHEMLLDAISERAEGGVGDLSDLTRAEGRLAGAQARAIDYDARLAMMEAAYIELFGEAPRHDALPQVVVPLPDAETALALVREANPELGVARAESLAAAKEAEAIDAERWPSVSVELSARQFSREDPTLGYNDVSVMLRGTLNLYSGGSAQARRDGALLRASRARQDERAVQLDLERRLLSADADLRARALRLQADRLALQADEQAFLTALDLFTIGRNGLTDVLDAQSDLFATSAAVIDSRVQLDLARFVALSLTGELLSFFDVGTIRHE